MTSVTITDFLLARIDEDEASANAWLRFEVRDSAPGNYAIPERVIAEAHAKRQLVRHHHRLVNTGVQMADANETLPDRCAECAGRQWPCRTVRLLASVYADHPDHDDSWRV